MVLIFDIYFIVVCNIGMVELGVCGSLWVVQIIVWVLLKVWKWGFKCQCLLVCELWELFEVFGAIYIKFGQFIVSLFFIFFKEYVDEFQFLLDQMVFILFRIVQCIVEDDFG